MGEATPQQNREDIIELRGNFKVITEKLNSHIQKQEIISKNIEKTINDSTTRQEVNQAEFIHRIQKTMNGHGEKLNQLEKTAIKNDQQIRGVKKVCQEKRAGLEKTEARDLDRRKFTIKNWLAVTGLVITFLTSMAAIIFK